MKLYAARPILFVRGIVTSLNPLAPLTLRSLWRSANCPSESTESFTFFFDCLKRECVIENIPPGRVVIGDQAAGLIAAMPIAAIGMRFNKYSTNLFG